LEHPIKKSNAKLPIFSRFNRINSHKITRIRGEFNYNRPKSEKNSKGSQWDCLGIKWIFNASGPFFRNGQVPTFTQTHVYMKVYPRPRRFGGWFASSFP